MMTTPLATYCQNDESPRMVRPLFITPMTLVSGVFFPADQLPPLLHSVAAWLPLSHAVQLTRPLLNGEIPANVTGHIAALAGITVVAFYIATILTRRRLLK